MSLPDQSSQTDCQGGGSEFELRIPILVNLFKGVLPTSTHSVGTWQATRAPHVIEFTCGDRVPIREGTNKVSAPSAGSGGGSVSRRVSITAATAREDFAKRIFCEL